MKNYEKLSSSCKIAGNTCMKVLPELAKNKKMTCKELKKVGKEQASQINSKINFDTLSSFNLTFLKSQKWIVSKSKGVYEITPTGLEIFKNKDHRWFADRYRRYMVTKNKNNRTKTANKTNKTSKGPVKARLTNGLVKQVAQESTLGQLVDHFVPNLDEKKRWIISSLINEN